MNLIHLHVDRRGHLYRVGAQVCDCGTTPVCAACLETQGWCDATGGRHPCEGAADTAQLTAAFYDTPEVMRR